MDKLTYHADQIAAETVEYGSDHSVHAVHLGTGDPEAGGHHWSFTRCFEDDDGVCTCREIQQATLYEGIRSFTVDRTGVRCVFESAAVSQAGFAEVSISFDVDDELWRQLADMLDTVFRDRPYYRRST